MTGSEGARPVSAVDTERVPEPAGGVDVSPTASRPKHATPQDHRPPPHADPTAVIEGRGDEAIAPGSATAEPDAREADSGWLDQHDAADEPEPVLPQPGAHEPNATAEPAAREAARADGADAAPPAPDDDLDVIDLAWVPAADEAEIADDMSGADDGRAGEADQGPGRAEPSESLKSKWQRQRSAGRHAARPAGGAPLPSEQSVPTEPPWPTHSDGRWVVGDAGNQPRTVARPTRRPAGAPVDTALDGAVVGDLVYRAASLRGFSHQESGKPRQDAFAVRVTRSENWLVMCVADGVSDGPRSEVAAEIASDAIARWLVTVLDESDIPAGPVEWEALVQDLHWMRARDTANREVVKRARTDVDKIHRAREAAARNVHPRDVEVPEKMLPQSHADVRALMATTAVCLVLAARPAPNGRYWYAVGVIAGDSASFLLHGRRWTQIVSPKDVSGDVADNGVRALPTKAPPSIRLGSLRAGDAVALFSDGISDPLGSGQGTLGRFLAGQWSTPPDLFDFGKQVGFYSRGWFDDRTAAVAWTREPDR